MKYFFVVPNLDAGGAERVTITIARILRKHGTEVEFLNLGSENGAMKSWIEPEFKMTSMGCKRVLAAYPKLCSFMKRHKDDRFFSSREHVNLVLLAASRKTGVNVIVRIPNMPDNKLTSGLSGFKMSVVKRFNKILLPKAKVIIAQNAEMRKKLLSFYGLKDELVVAINNPVDKEFVLNSAKGSINPFNESECNYLAVCNIQPSKGIDVLINAWPNVKKQISNAHMYVLGRDDSEYAQIIKSSAKNLCDFTFLGFIGNPYPYLKHTNVFVLPSKMEGFPNVVLEAMCFNRPIVATDCVEVISEIVKPGNNGYRCKVDDSISLSEAMVKASNLNDIHNSYNLFDEEKLINLFQ